MGVQIIEVSRSSLREFIMNQGEWRTWCSKVSCKKCISLCSKDEKEQEFVREIKETMKVPACFFSLRASIIADMIDLRTGE